MKLNELFEDNSLPATEITGLTQNSAKVKPGFVFFAVKGYSVDGHLFIDDAIKNGAVAVVSEQKLSLKEVHSILVKNITISMAQAACKFYNYPSDKLKVIGLTGTKGKTSTAYLTESILFAAGLKPAVFGTINYRANGQLISQALQMPAGSKEAFECNKKLDSVLGKLKVSMENYPTLKSDATMTQAMKTYNEVEEHIAAARRFYNSAVTQLRNYVMIFPTSLFKDLVKEEMQSTYYEIEESGQRGAINASDYLK